MEAGVANAEPAVHQQWGGGLGQAGAMKERKVRFWGRFRESTEGKPRTAADRSG